MPNYEHFKKYDEWSKQKPAADAGSSPPPERKSGLAKVMKSLKGLGGKKS
jgi:hypothetical protein